VVELSATPNIAVPALFTNTSIVPSFAIILSKAFLTLASSVSDTSKTVTFSACDKAFAFSAFFPLVSLMVA
jgi:hypothetical protein